MKVVHLSTYDAGGAGIAAYNLHLSLLAQGIDSVFFVLDQSNEEAIKLKKIESPKSTFFQKALNYFGFPQTIQQINYRLVKNKTALGAPFTFPVTGIDVTTEKIIKEADIINLHWVADFIDWSTFFKKTTKPIVWTLHDMNSFMGGFHYSIDLKQNATSLALLELDVLNVKKNYIKQAHHLAIVSPSKWLMDLSKNSDMFSAYKHHHIFNSINLDNFILKDMTVLRDQYLLPKEKIIFTFVSEDVKNYRKGFDLLMNIVEKLSVNENILFCAIGKFDEENTLPNIKYFGKINDYNILSDIYSLSNAVILPSREDNLPNVMLEAMACGSPVISFKTGGMVDVIKDNFNGILAEEITGDSLLIAVQLFVDNYNNFDKQAIKEFCHHNFSFKQQATSYIDLYKDILKDKATHVS